MPHTTTTSVATTALPSSASKSRSIRAKDRKTTAAKGSKHKGKASKVHMNAKEALEAAARTTEDHLYAKKTETSYKGQVSRALAFASAATEPGWKEAFTGVSSLTPTVLLAYFASKCQEEGEGLSYKTAEGIKSGLKHYLRTDLGCLGDTWTCDKDGSCTGTSRQSLATTYNDMVSRMKHLQDLKTIEERTEGK
ncbi:hypothetical protein BGZ95_002139 [Linnemannia exigua]|uniref:Uncharacterized protein n=1 Tax=Linnemannia exigua TaxID=604196 RepID=A0AAD4D5X3_9FUNG|nr:hypothetical protein BGZ95_002139 [Linnemannia exigua]